MEAAAAVTPFYPWSSIWTRPRATIQKILDANLDRHVLVLAALSGIAQGFQRASDVSAGEELGVTAIVATVCVAGAIGGIVSLYIGGLLCWITGKWIGGKATARQIRMAIAWAGVPWVGLVISWFVKIALFGRELFVDLTPRIESDGTAAVAFLGFSLVELTLLVWTIVLSLKCLGQAQGFSAWRAMGNIILAVLLVVVLMILLFIAIDALAT